MTVRQVRYQRDRKINALARRGYSQRLIADVVGVHHKTVWRVLNGVSR